MIPIKLFQRLTLVCLLLAHVSASADQTDVRLDALFETLKSSRDVGELMQTESEIWDIWYQSGQDEIDTLMLDAAEQVQRGDLAAAETLYTQVTERMPDFSEGWNRRATVRFYQRDYEGSLADIEKTLYLEPRHFGAIWGLGMILGLRRDYERAIFAFERLLEIKPNAGDAQPRIELLKEELAKQAV